MAGTGATGWIGRYRADRILGTGGFATVWLATDETLDAQVAIKVLAENWSQDVDVRRRFTEEARILWRLESERIVRVYTVDELEDGRPFFVMEFCDAGTLETRMVARHDAAQPYPIEEAVALSLAISEGLAAAHAHGIVHRDLKPSNVLFKTGANGERLLIADFGIARSLEAAGATTAAVGTPHYMAPEQAMGRADRRSDVYSAAVILYELLAGAVPFPHQSVGEVLRAKLMDTAPDVRTLRPDVPAALAATIARALASEPDDRQASAQAWHDELAAGGAVSRSAATMVEPPVTPAQTPPPPAPAPTPPPAPVPPTVPAPAFEAPTVETPAPATVLSPPTLGPPGGGPPPPPSPPPPGSPGGSRRRALPAVILVAVLALIAAVVGVSLLSSGSASADVFRAPAYDPGANGFTQPTVPDKSKTFSLSKFLKPPATAYARPSSAPAGSIASFSGNTPGLYGGTQKLTVCDAKQLVRFLTSEPAKAAAWAAVEGIRPEDIPAYVGSLTDAILRTDTRVINHGFVNGRANPIPEVLQAGTAVLVDSYGVPRARCFCGNPLLPPVPLKGTIRFTGTSWPGFDPAQQTVIVQSTVQVTQLVIIDSETGGAFLRPAGTSGDKDTPAPPEALAGSPFAPRAASPSSTTVAPGGPAPPGSVSGTYTIGSTTANGSSCGGSSIPTLTGQQLYANVAGTTITFSLSGNSLSAPYDPASASFSLSETESGGSLSLGGTSGFKGTFTSTTSGTSLALQINLFGTCTITAIAPRTGDTATAPGTTPPTTAAQPPVDITKQGSVSASSTASGFSASEAVDGDPSTSWFSVGASEGPNSTFTWQTSGDHHITTISITGNEGNSNPSFRDGFGYHQTEIQVIDSSGKTTFDQTFPGPSDSNRDIVANADAVGSTVKLILQSRESDQCGGFAELAVDAFPT